MHVIVEVVVEVAVALCKLGRIEKFQVVVLDRQGIVNVGCETERVKM